MDCVEEAKMHLDTEQRVQTKGIGKQSDSLERKKYVEQGERVLA